MERLLTHPAIVAGLSKVESRIERLSGSSTLPGINAGAERIIQAGGKRLRPALTLGTVLAFGKAADRRAVTAAACIELIHAASLIHDDLMDGASQRRGTPTLNATLGQGKALVIGDFILARAGLAAITAVSKPVAEVLAATTVELAEGQYLEAVDQFNRDRTEESALRSITGKTAALFRASCLVGALCAKASPEERAKMAVYGEKFGLVFQILDDLLDLTLSSETLGKPAGNDVRQSVYTLPLLRARGADPHLLDGDAETILARVRDSGIVDDTLAYCRDLAAQAVDALPAAKDVGLLADLPGSYIAKAADMISTRARAA